MKILSMMKFVYFGSMKVFKEYEMIRMKNKFIEFSYI